MEFLQVEKIVNTFIKDNNLANNNKNKMIIKMALKNPSVNEMNSQFEIFEYLKSKFLK